MKRCPGCQEKFDGETVFCPKCDKLDQAQRLAAKASAAGVADVLKKDFRFQIRVGVIALVAALGLWGIVGYAGWKKLEKAADTMVTNRLAILEYGVSNKLHLQSLLINSNINAQFQREAIQALIQMVASNNAATILTNRINPVVADFTNSIASRLTNFEAIVFSGSNSVQELKEYTEFLRLYTEAASGRRWSFHKLFTMGKDQKSPFRDLALNAMHKIWLDASSSQAQASYPVSWRTNAEPSKLSLSQLKRLLPLILFHERTAFVRFVWARNDFTRKQRMEFLIDLLPFEENLFAYATAADLFTDGTKGDLKGVPYPNDTRLDWWAKNASLIKD